jgi:hypothetical protein
VGSGPQPWLDAQRERHRPDLGPRGALDLQAELSRKPLGNETRRGRAQTPSDARERPLIDGLSPPRTPYPRVAGQSPKPARCSSCRQAGTSVTFGPVGALVRAGFPHSRPLISLRRRSASGRRFPPTRRSPPLRSLDQPALGAACSPDARSARPLSLASEPLGELREQATGLNDLSLRGGAVSSDEGSAAARGGAGKGGLGESG